MWIDILKAIISGITVALVWAGLVWAFTASRNKRLEKALRNTIARCGTHSGDEGFGVTVKNATDHAVVIRDVYLLTNKPSALRLNYQMPIEECENETDASYRMEMEILYSPETLPLAINSQGFVQLPPHSGGVWFINNQFLSRHFDLDLDFTQSRIVVEYPTLFGDPKVIVIFSNDANSKLLQTVWKEQKSQIQRKMKQQRKSSSVLLEDTPSGSQ